MTQVTAPPAEGYRSSTRRIPLLPSDAMALRTQWSGQYRAMSALWVSDSAMFHVLLRLPGGAEEYQGDTVYFLKLGKYIYLTPQLAT